MQALQERPTMTVMEASNFIGVSAPTMYSITERKDFTALIRDRKEKVNSQESVHGMA